MNKLTSGERSTSIAAMTAVSVSMLSPPEPDLSGASKEDVAAAIMKVFGMRPFVTDDQRASAHYVRPCEVNAWLAGHGAAQWRFRQVQDGPFQRIRFELDEART